MEQPFSNMRDLVQGFARAMNLISTEVEDHHEKVAYLAFRLAEALELEPREQQLAIYGALLHDIGSVSLKEQVTLRDVERSAGRLAKTGGALLRALPATRPLSEIVLTSQTPWDRLRGLALRVKTPLLLGQIVHLADTVSLLLGQDELSILNRVEYIRKCVREGEKSYHPDVLRAFDRISCQDALWMDLFYMPGRFLEFLSLNSPVSLEGAIELTELVSQIIDFRSPFTAMHSAGVAAAAVSLASYAGMSERECRMMRIAGNLHDLGKLKIPREILEKPGKLTDQEFNIIKEHAYYTYVLLKDIQGFDQIARWAAFHHEKLSGQGYPFRLRREDIPLGARIMAVADMFSAITEDRPYRKGMEREQAIRVLRENVEREALSESITDLLIAHYEEIDRQRDESSRRAGERYFSSMADDQEVGAPE